MDRMDRGWIIISVADPDPGSGAFLTSGSGMDKKSTSRIILPRQFFLVKIPQFFDADADLGIFLIPDPGSGMEKSDRG